MREREPAQETEIEALLYSNFEETKMLSNLGIEKVKDEEFEAAMNWYQRKGINNDICAMLDHLKKNPFDRLRLAVSPGNMNRKFKAVYNYSQRRRMTIRAFRGRDGYLYVSGKKPMPQPAKDFQVTTAEERIAFNRRHGA